MPSSRGSDTFIYLLLLIIYIYFLFIYEKKKLREATYTAAVCKFWGGLFFVFGLVPSVAQLSSASFYFLYFHWRGWSRQYFAFVELIDLDLNDDDIFDQSEA